MKTTSLILIHHLPIPVTIITYPWHTWQAIIYSITYVLQFQALDVAGHLLISHGWIQEWAEDTPKYKYTNNVRTPSTHSPIRRKGAFILGPTKMYIQIPLYSPPMEQYTRRRTLLTVLCRKVSKSMSDGNDNALLAFSAYSTRNPLSLNITRKLILMRC